MEWEKRLELGEAESKAGGKPAFPESRNAIQSSSEWPGLEGTIKILLFPALPWAWIHPCSEVPHARPPHGWIVAASSLWSSVQGDLLQTLQVSVRQVPSAPLL